ncbi:MAG: PorV/PorQ family protein, partial [Planctomycetes bacterium]|nr:PorV/PorQ family protein [Planctomycetota bacterium]
MYKKLVIICVISILAIASVSMAGSDRRLGTSGAQYLKIPVGSRGTAMGGAIGADVYGAEAIFYNPAGVAMIDGTEVMFSYLNYFAGMNLNYFAITTAVEDFGSIGISAKVLSVGDIVKTTWNASTPEGTGEIFNPSSAVIGLTYSRVLTDRVSFGITGKFINEQIDLVSASGMAIDFGVNYDTKWNNLRLGFVLKNLGPSMAFEGEGLDYSVQAPGTNPAVSPAHTFTAKSASFELPAWAQLSMAWDAYNQDMHRATVFGTFQANNFSKDLFRGAFEYAYDEKYFIRGGYTLDDDQVDYLYGLTFGAGAVFS